MVPPKINSSTLSGLNGEHEITHSFPPQFKPDKVDDYLKTCEEDLGWDKIVLIHAYNTHSKFNYKTYKNIPLSVNGRISKQGMDRIIAMGIGTGKTIISSI